MVSSNPRIVEYQVLNGYSTEWAYPIKLFFQQLLTYFTS